MDIATGLGIAKASLDIIRGIREGLKTKNLSKDEILACFGDLQDRIIDIRTALADADEENRELIRKVEELEGELNRRQHLREDYEFRNNLIWNKGSREGPYCPVCFDLNNKLVRLQHMGDGRYRCVVHKYPFVSKSE